MKKGFSSFFDYLDPKDIENINEDQDFTMEAPTSMLFTPDEMGISAKDVMSSSAIKQDEVEQPEAPEQLAEIDKDTPEATTASLEKKASSIWDYLNENDGRVAFEKEAPEIWKHVNGKIIRTTGSIIEK